MYIWSNSDDGRYMGGSHIIGNGKMLVRADGPNITSLSGPPYGNMPFLSAVVFDEGHIITSLSEREEGGGVWNHKLTYSEKSIVSFEKTAAFIKITDHMDCGRCVFVRRFRSIHPLVMKLIIPSYVKQYYFESYRLAGSGCRCIILVIPPDQSADSRISIEQRLIIALNGDADYNEQKKELRLKDGKGDIIFASGFAEQAMSAAVFAKNNYEKSLTRTKAYYGAALKNIGSAEKKPGTSSKIKDSDTVPDYSVKAYKILETSAIFLKSLQSSDGGVITGPSRPAVETSCQYYILRSFLALGCRAEAKAILNFIYGKFKRTGSVSEYESAGSDTVRDLALRSVLAPAYCLLAVEAYVKATADKYSVYGMIPLIIYCAEFLQKNMNCGLPTGSGRDIYYAGGGSDCPSDAKKSILYIKGLRAAAALAEAFNIKSIDTDSFKLSAERAESAFFENFTAQGKLGRSFLISGTAHSERFRYGVCDMCGDSVYPPVFSALERSGYSHRYLCIKCFNAERYNFSAVAGTAAVADIDTDTDNVTVEEENADTAESGSVAAVKGVAAGINIKSADVMLPYYLGQELFGRNFVLNFIDRHIKNGFMPSVCEQISESGAPSNIKSGGNAKYFFSDTGFTLYALTKLGGDKKDAVFKRLCAAADNEYLWREYGNSGELSSFTTAVCAEALVLYLKEHKNPPRI